MRLSSTSARLNRCGRLSPLSNRTVSGSAIEPDIMNKSPQDRKTVFATPWFQVLAAVAPDGGQPHYVIQGADFVVVVAVTKHNQILLVRQFRVAAAAVTLRSEEHTSELQ